MTCLIFLMFAFSFIFLILFLYVLFCADKYIKLISILPLMASFYLFILGLIMNDEPTALDVYRGRTTLEITYHDSIPIDTVVVFK